MNIQELCLVGSEKLPIVIIILNNHSLGLIRDVHEKYYNNRCIGSVEGFSQPNLKILSKSYDIDYMLIESKEELKDKISNFKVVRPLMLEFSYSNKTSIRPELLGMDTIDKQSTYIPIDIMEKISSDCKVLECV